MSISLPWPWRLPGRRVRTGTAGAEEGSPSRETAGQKASGAQSVTQARFGGRDDEPTEWVTVYLASGLEEAHIVKGALEAQDIPVLVRNQALSRLVGSAAAWGVEVQVPRVLEDRARELLLG